MISFKSTLSDPSNLEALNTYVGTGGKERRREREGRREEGREGEQGGKERGR